MYVTDKRQDCTECLLPLPLSEFDIEPARTVGGQFKPAHYAACCSRCKAAIKLKGAREQLGRVIEMYERKIAKIDQRRAEYQKKFREERERERRMGVD